MEERELQKKATPSLRGLSVEAIKLIAVILMLADHYGWIKLSLFDAGGQVVHFLGRVTMPVMCYFAALGFAKTHSIGKYLSRLLVFALISQPFFNLVFDRALWVNPPHLNVLFTLFLSVCFLCVCEERLPFFKSAWVRAVISALIMLSSVFCDWRCWAVVMTAAFYYLCVKPFEGKEPLSLDEREALREKRAKNILLVLVIVAALLVLDTFLSCYQYGFYTLAVNSFYRIGVVLASPLLIFYNGEKARGGKFGKYFFYVFYPAHLAVLWAVLLR